MSAEKATVIEPEIIDETGQVVAPAPKDHARPQGDNGGLLGGVLVLTVGFLATVTVILFSVFILCPLVLLGRLFGLVVSSVRR